MCRKFRVDELNTMDHQAKTDVICKMQDRLDRLEHDYENLMEQVTDDVVDTALKPPRRPKKKGKKEEDLRAFLQEEIPHDVPAEKLNALFGEGNYKSMPDEVCWQLCFEPARWTQKSTSSKSM